MGHEYRWPNVLTRRRSIRPIPLCAIDLASGRDFDGDYLLVSEDGANLEVRHTPIAFSIKGKTWVNNHAHILKFEHYCTQVFMEYYITLNRLFPQFMLYS